MSKVIIISVIAFICGVAVMGTINTARVYSAQNETLAALQDHQQTCDKYKVTLVEYREFLTKYAKLQDKYLGAVNELSRLQDLGVKVDASFLRKGE